MCATCTEPRTTTRRTQTSARRILHGRSARVCLSFRPIQVHYSAGEGSLFDGWLWLRWHWRRWVEEGAQGGLVEDGDVEGAGAVELGAGVFACDEVGGLLADGGGDASAGRFDEFLGCLAGERGQRPGEDEGKAGEGGGGDALLGGHFQARIFQALD